MLSSSNGFLSHAVFLRKEFPFGCDLACKFLVEPADRCERALQMWGHETDMGAIESLVPDQPRRRQILVVQAKKGSPYTPNHPSSETLVARQCLPTLDVHQFGGVGPSIPDLAAPLS